MTTRRKHRFHQTHPGRRGWQAVFALSCALLSCGGEGDRGLAATEGRIAVALTLAPGIVVERLDYVIRAQDVTLLAGAIDVSDPSARPSVFLTGVPAGPQRTIYIAGTSIDGRTSCSGSATFDLQAGVTATVNVRLDCTHGSDAGSLSVSADFNICPQVKITLAAPTRSPVGVPISLVATASDQDGDPVALTWSAPSGTFVDPHTATTSFTCDREGALQLRVQAHDGQCAKSSYVTVTCLAFCSVQPDGTPCGPGATCHAGRCGTPAPPIKELCLAPSAGRTIFAYATTQTGRTPPIRRIMGPATLLLDPAGLVANPAAGELYTGLADGRVLAFPWTAAGNVPPQRILGPIAVSPGWELQALSPDSGNLLAIDPTAGRVLTLDRQTGALIRTLTPGSTVPPRPRAIAATASDLFVTFTSDTSADQRVAVWNTSAPSGAAPKRILGTPDAPACGGALAVNATHNEVFGACANTIAVYDASASGPATPKRLLVIDAVKDISAILIDEAADTLWVLGRIGFANHPLQEFSRTATGQAQPLRPPLLLSAPSRLAPCQ